MSVPVAAPGIHLDRTYRQVEVWLKDGTVLRVERLDHDGLPGEALTHDQIDAMARALEEAD